MASLEQSTIKPGEQSAQTLNISSGTSYLQSPEDLQDSLLDAVKNMGGQRAVRSYLDSFYVKLKSQGDDVSADKAVAYARIYEKHGMNHHAQKIRDFGVGAALATEDIQTKLYALSAYLPGQTEMVYEFGRYLAGRLNPELVPQGFHLAAELALHDLQSGIDGFSNEPIASPLVGLPPLIYSTIRMHITDIAKAIYPETFSKKVAESVDTVNKAIVAAKEREQEQYPKQMDIDLQKYFRDVETIKRHILTRVNSHEDCTMWERNDSPNPYYNQIEGNGAISLEMYYGTPSKLHTPLGEYQISDGSSSRGGMEEVMHQLTEELGLVEIVPVRVNSNGVYGPVYKISRDLDGNQLPDVIPTKRASYLSTREADRLWDEVKPSP